MEKRGAYFDHAPGAFAVNKFRTALRGGPMRLNVDDSVSRRVWALAPFTLACVLVILLEYAVQLSATAYWIDHLLFGVGFPFLLFAVFGSWRLAFGLTIAWSLGNELWEDQLSRAIFTVDWDHLAGDQVGIFLAWVIARVAFSSESAAPKK